MILHHHAFAIKFPRPSRASNRLRIGELFQNSIAHFRIATLSNSENSLVKSLKLLFIKNKFIYLLVIISVMLLAVSNQIDFSSAQHNGSPQRNKSTILSDENFTFAFNGSFLQLDAGRDWPFNSRREISFKFRTRSPHGLLIYQTFDYRKLIREEDQEVPVGELSKPKQILSKISRSSIALERELIPNESRENPELNPPVGTVYRRVSRYKRRVLWGDSSGNADSSNGSPMINRLASNAITASASEKLVNSLFSSSPAAAINGNSFSSKSPISPLISSSRTGLIPTNETPSPQRTHRVSNPIANLDVNRAIYGSVTSPSKNAESTVFSSSAINLVSASLYELYLKLENGRLKIMYEFGTRLNQTYCGRGLNDDRWHRVDLRVDPELNQMTLILDQSITVEIILNLAPVEDETSRRDDLVFTNSILYLGGLDSNATIVRNVKKRLYAAQFIGCIGGIMLKTDLAADSLNQPVTVDRMVLVKRGCIDKCDTDNFCMHDTTCVNLYTSTKCDCFGTIYEDRYCWKDHPTTISMLGHSTIIHRIYDWKDRHHSSINRLSIQFRTVALDSILFFAYGDLSNQQSLRNMITNSLPASFNPVLVFSPQTVNISNLASVHRPTSFQTITNSNYLAVSLTNGTVTIEISFGDQPIILSNFLYDKVYNRTAHLSPAETSPTSNYYRPLNLSDGRWHNITLLHNNRQLYLYVDNYSTNFTIPGKNYHLYFDPSIYVGGVPNLLANESRALLKPFNLRHKFVGCLRSIYFNQHDILLALRHKSPMTDFRDQVGKPMFDSCFIQDPNSLPLTMRSGKSYLTFQMLNSQKTFTPSHEDSLDMKAIDHSNSLRKSTRIEFEYRTRANSFFLAGGHLRDLIYHDLGGFWTLHAQDSCNLHFTISSGIASEPEQVIKLNTDNTECDADAWYKVSISIVMGDKYFNITRSKVHTAKKIEDQYSHTTNEPPRITERSYLLKSSFELLHQVQLGGDIAKFGEVSSIPFVGCLRKIRINGHQFDSRDFVTSSAMIGSPSSSLNQSSSTNLSTGFTHSDLISNKISQGYVTLDSCQLVNACSSHNPCDNNGSCKINELGETECDCSKTGYTGRRCHFSVHKQSCHELYTSGQRSSGYYIIDLDRNGPLKPIRVKCNMEEDPAKIETVLSHNLPAEYLVKRHRTNNYILDITYTAFQHLYSHDGFYLHDDSDPTARREQDEMLKTLIAQSLYCRQYFRYDCRSAPLELGNATWMEAPFPRSHRLTSLDGMNHGQCMCATTEKKCLDSNRVCNCDSGETDWTEDSYELIGHEDVGLTRLVILSQDHYHDKVATNVRLENNLESLSRFTLSDLRCFKAKQHENQHEITFKTSDSYIEVPGWKKGDISFSFRTASVPPAIILFQLATSRNHGYFRLTLVSDVRLLFEFIVNRKPRKLYLTSNHKLNNGEWQQVFIEYDVANLRLEVNDDFVLVDLDTNDYIGTFEGPLFIGGAPSKYLAGDNSKRNGFTGCFRNLRTDGQLVDLKSYLNPSMPTVIGACKPSCSKNLCQNGGKCIEYWGSYVCECSNPIAHSGNNCEININTNSITFVTPGSHYVQLSNEVHFYPTYLTKNILINIRTYQEFALILYANDHLNNFIQLHKNGSSLVLTYNTNNTIVTAQVPIDESINNVQTVSRMPIEVTSLSSASTSLSKSNETTRLNSSVPIAELLKVSNTSGSGQPIQIKIERHRLKTNFYVNNNLVVVEKPLVLLTSYAQNPWINPEMETVRPPRPKLGSKTYSQMFLASVDEYFNTRLPGFAGCIQGLSIDNQLFDFNRAHLDGEFKGGYKIGCKMHCDSLPCKNHGICIENWAEDKIQCNCAETSFIGSLCDEDIAAIFDGQTSYFRYDLSRKQPVMRTDTGIWNSSISNEIRNSSVALKDSVRYNSFFEISFAFSSETATTQSKSANLSVQVMILVIKANSAEHFFLGLTPDGSLLIQEDFGGSMSLSRLIKHLDLPFNDGHRHMVKYSRLNHMIQIIVDNQTFLPTTSVVTTRLGTPHSNVSALYVGTIDENLNNSPSTKYSNYSGCISNLVLKLDDSILKPLSEAFGQDVSAISSNNTRETSSTMGNADVSSFEGDINSKLSPHLTREEMTTYDQFDFVAGLMTVDTQISSMRVVRPVKETVSDSMGTIIARDVEQGMCAQFRRVESLNEKRSINEPKLIPLVEPRPVYKDPPRLKVYQRGGALNKKADRILWSRMVFIGSMILLSLVFSLSLLYAYILQIRYKSEKFRCDTPFFHKRNDSETSNT